MYIEDDTIALALLKYCEEIARSDQQHRTLHLLRDDDAYILVSTAEDVDSAHKAGPHEAPDWIEMYNQLTYDADASDRRATVDVQIKVYWDQFVTYVNEVRKEQMEQMCERADAILLLSYERAWYDADGEETVMGCIAVPLAYDGTTSWTTVDGRNTVITREAVERVARQINAHEPDAPAWREPAEDWYTIGLLEDNDTLRQSELVQHADEVHPYDETWPLVYDVDLEIYNAPGDERTIDQILPQLGGVVPAFLHG